MLYHKIMNDTDEMLWRLITENEGREFHTTKGLPFTYTIKKGRTGEPLGELIISRREKSITRSTILLAYETAQKVTETEGCVKGPKKLGVFGASYIYPILIELGLITNQKE